MHASLAARLWPVVGANWLNQFLLAVVGSLLLAASAQIAVPFWPVPVTMQTLAVLLIGILFGAELGAATVLLYIAEGAAGLPVFAHFHSGPVYMAGPTGGYLAGFVLAAALVGALTAGGRGKSLAMALLACVAGEFVIMALGFAWLAHLIGPAKAWAGGVQPFLFGDGIKLLIAALVTQTSWRQADPR